MRLSLSPALAAWHGDLRSSIELNAGCAYLQALLDVYTIQREVGRLDNLRVGLIGDLANGRTVRSLAYLLSMYSGIRFYFVAPDVVRMQACPPREFFCAPATGLLMCLVKAMCFTCTFEGALGGRYRGGKKVRPSN